MTTKMSDLEQFGKEDGPKVNELFKNNMSDWEKIHHETQKLLMVLDVVIETHSKMVRYDHLLMNYKNLKIKKPGKFILFRDRVILIQNTKK